MNGNDINWTAAIILIVFVVLTNLGLWLAVARRDRYTEMDTLRKVTRALRQPWQSDEADMQELAERVAGLRREAAQTPEKEVEKDQSDLS